MYCLWCNCSCPATCKSACFFSSVLFTGECAQRSWQLQRASPPASFHVYCSYPSHARRRVCAKQLPLVRLQLPCIKPIQPNQSSLRSRRGLRMSQMKRTHGRCRSERKRMINKHATASVDRQQKGAEDVTDEEEARWVQN